jgi:hypothetical protein
VTDQDGKTTAYAYDDEDRLSTVTDANSHSPFYSRKTAIMPLPDNESKKSSLHLSYLHFRPHPSSGHLSPKYAI